MKSLRLMTLLTIIIFSVTHLKAASISHTSVLSYANDSANSLQNLKLKGAERLTGIRLSLIQKIEYSLLKRKLKKIANKQLITPKQQRKATLSLIFGIGCIVLAFIPIFPLLSIPAAVLAVIFGIQSLKGNSNAKGIIGTILGGLFSLIVTLIIVTTQRKP